MPIPEMRTAKETSTEESDEWATELPAGSSSFSSAFAATALGRIMAGSSDVVTFDGLFQAAPRIPILILGGAQEG